jgi:hypothetical protein
VKILARCPWWIVPLTIFLGTRLLGAAVILLAAQSQISEPSLVPGQVVPTLVDPPTYLHVIANWDGQWYRLIAGHGYPGHLPMYDGAVQQNSWAFYPMYPFLVRAVMLTGASFGLAASIVSTIAGALVMRLLYRMLSPSCGRFAASLSVLALCTYPAAAVLQAAYSESLAMLLALAALWCLRERRYGALLVVALLLAFTRPIVLPLALVVGVHWLARWRSRASDPFPRRDAIRLALVGLGVAGSFLLWPIVAALVTGRADAYFVTANSWYGQDNHGWPSWLVVLVGGGDVAFGVFVGIIALVFGLLIARPATRLWGLELRSWAWAYPLYLLGTTRPTSSIIRYAMLAVVPWWPFPEVGGSVRGTGRRLGLAAFVGVLGMLTQYAWVRWIFIVSPHGHGFP